MGQKLNNDSAAPDDEALSQVTGGAEMWNPTREEHYLFIYNTRLGQGQIDPTVKFDDWLAGYLDVPGAILVRNSWLQDADKEHKASFLGNDEKMRVTSM